MTSYYEPPDSDDGSDPEQERELWLAEQEQNQELESRRCTVCTGVGGSDDPLDNGAGWQDCPMCSGRGYFSSASERIAAQMDYEGLPTDDELADSKLLDF